jgi:hypothetical protein
LPNSLRSPGRLELLRAEIKILENAVDEEICRTQEQINYTVQNGKVLFSKDVLRVHRMLKRGLVHYVLGSDLLFILSSPVIYSLIVPAMILDLFCGFYQFVCFPIYRIPKVDRSLYIRIDRHKLGYLNAVEKLNCTFCAYFNGTLAYAREIASRTEQYWCPIRHAVAVKGGHGRYEKFFEYGDAESYSKKLKQLRNELELTSPGSQPSNK